MFLLELYSVKPVGPFTSYTQHKGEGQGRSMPGSRVGKPSRGVQGGRKGRLTNPVRLGLLLTEEATELTELSEDADGLRFRLAGVVAITRLTAAALALAGVVEGKPILVTLWTGANKPYLR